MRDDQLATAFDRLPDPKRDDSAPERHTDFTSRLSQPYRDPEKQP